ncbi:DUF4397 domain-containing protein [Falsibacillus albus]|uniref:DUF4397 domain-containing protein n=1 Tax=Falsibacillus albus TaxID=2478915 RepID=A0A3L7JWR4_9BACI|nr:DUF4397 domain-containing protein [Falsibacillus albus]RLQ95186.1 DUF4397 domain-containing protein [Falsibacillus albus]
MNNQDQYFQRAAVYDLLACYYKYIDPNQHIHYYQQHLKYMKKGLESQRSELSLMRQPANVRFLHASPGSPNIDIYINSHKIFSNISFKDISEYLSLPAGKYHIDIYPAGTSVTTIISKKISVEPGKFYTYAAIGKGEKLQLLPYVDSPMVPANETKLRFIHLSPDAPAVDIAVKSRDVVFPNISYKQATDYLGLTPMTLDLEVRAAGADKAILDIPNIKLKPNRSYTIFAVGLLEGEPPLETILIKG